MRKRITAFCVLLILAALLISCKNEPNYYQVTFDTDGGTAISSVWVVEGEKITEPTHPTKEGFTFDGWTCNGKDWNFAQDTVTAATVLIAKWTENKPPETPDDQTGGSQGGEEGDQTGGSQDGNDGGESENDLFAALDKTGCPETLLTLDEYIGATGAQKKEYYSGFENDAAFLRWYQEAYRLSGKKGAYSSKTGYMDTVDKSGFPETVLTWEEYRACNEWESSDGWRIQSPYYKLFANYNDFSRWSHEAQEIYEEEQNRQEIGDNDTEIDMGK